MVLLRQTICSHEYKNNKELTYRITGRMEKIMKTRFENGRLVLEINDNLEINLNPVANIEYRSHINRMQTVKPDNWVSVVGQGNDGNAYKAWYFVEDFNAINGLEDINYEEPSDIVDEYGKIIYDSDAE